MAATERAAMLDFLARLREHNTKEWMDEHRSEYLTHKAAFEAQVTDMIARVARFEPLVADLEPKHCVFRINRDIRFSKDKSPYKTNFGAVIQPGGKKSRFASYYFHLEPGGKSMVAGGIYMPSNKLLAYVRQEIDYNESQFRKIITDPAFQAAFGELHGERLKTAPKGYPKDHPAIDLLRLKSYVGLHTLSDADAARDDYPERVAQLFATLAPLCQFLNQALEEADPSEA